MNDDYLDIGELRKLSNKSREEAIASGFVRYKSYHPCTSNHIGYRYTIDTGCCDCSDLSNKRSHTRVVKEKLAEKSRPVIKRNILRFFNDASYRNRLVSEDKKARLAVIKQGGLCYKSRIPCVLGHEPKRLTSNGMCFTCSNMGDVYVSE